MTARLPDNEITRLALLHSLEILDTSSEEVFDRVTRIAARIFDVPVALISLIDRDRQWFKSKVGLSATQTPRDVAFCAHAILRDEVMVVPDAHADATFASNPLVTGAPFVRFYAGAPLTIDDDRAIGTLCVIDHRPREFTAADQSVLNDLAEIVRRELRQRHATLAMRAVQQDDAHALDVSEAQFSAVFQQAAAGMAIIGLDGRWLQVNRKVLEITGYGEAELLAKRFQDITVETDLAEDERQVVALLAGKSDSYTMEKRYWRKDGSPVWVQLTVALARARDGKPLHFISVLQDISARRTAEALLKDYQAQLEQRVRDRTRELTEANLQLSRLVRRGEDDAELLRAQKAELRAVIDNAQDAYVAVDEDDRIVEWNRQAESMFGWAAADILGRSLVDTLVPHRFRTGLPGRMQRLRGERRLPGISEPLRFFGLRASGMEFPAELRISWAPKENGEIVFAFVSDITQRTRAEQALLESRETLQTIADNLPILIGHIDRDLRYQFNNAAYSELFGASHAQMKGRYVADVLPPAMFAILEPLFLRALAGERVVCDDIRFPAYPGRVWSGTYIPDIRAGDVVGFYVMSQDVTERKRLEESLVDVAMRDPLTGLPNRRGLNQKVQELSQRRDPAHRGFALFFLDLDGFKQVNDTYGHDVGDALLRQVAVRLVASVRDVDFVSRLAGDEFIIICPGVGQARVAVEIAESLCRALSQPFLVGAQSIRTGSSIGVSVGESVPETIDAVLSKADAAMYLAKKSGRNTCRMFNDKEA